MRRMSAPQVCDYLATSPDVLLLDVREPWEFEICHIEGSQLLPLNHLPSELSQFDPEQEILIICHHGVRSLHACQFMYHNGFTRLINLDGGVDAWARSVDLSMPVY